MYSNYLKNSTIFEKESLLNIMCCLISSTNSVWNIFHSKKNWPRYDQKMFIDLLVKFNENPSGGSFFVPWGQTDAWAYGQTDVTKLIVNFRNFANPPKRQKRSIFEAQEEPYCEVCLIMTYLCNKMYTNRVQMLWLYRRTEQMWRFCSETALRFRGSSSRTEQEMANFSSNPPTL